MKILNVDYNYDILNQNIKSYQHVQNTVEILLGVELKSSKLETTAAPSYRVNFTLVPLQTRPTENVVKFF